MLQTRQQQQQHWQQQQQQQQRQHQLQMRTRKAEIALTNTLKEKRVEEGSAEEHCPTCTYLKKGVLLNNYIMMNTKFWLKNLPSLHVLE